MSDEKWKSSFLHESWAPSYEPYQSISYGFVRQHSEWLEEEAKKTMKWAKGLQGYKTKVPQPV